MGKDTKFGARTPRQSNNYAAYVAQLKAEEPSAFKLQSPYDQSSLQEVADDAVITSPRRITYQPLNVSNDMKPRRQWRNKESHQDDPELTGGDFFGKPGAGAPMLGDQKKKKFIEYESVEDEEKKGFNMGFGQPGAGAPRRTGSGRVITDLRGDGTIRFGQKENRQRYKQDSNSINSYRQELKQQMKERKEAEKRNKDESFQLELEVLKTDQFGKPGAGAPMRTSSGRVAAQRSMKNVGTLEGPADSGPKLKEQNSFTWGKGVGNPERQQTGKLVNRKGLISNTIRHTDKNIHYTTTTALTSPRYGGDSPRIKRSYIPDDDDGTFMQNDRGGAGAPMKDRNGRAIAQRTKNITGISSDENIADMMRKKRAADEYRQQQQSLIAEKKREKQRWKKFDQEFTGMDYGTLMKDHSTGPGYPRRDPLTGLIKGGGLKSSDVTQSTVAMKHYATNRKSHEYHDELAREAEERNMRRQLDKLKEKQEEMQHTQAYNDYWGRPGGGAPAASGAKKANLNLILHSQQQEDGRLDYNKAQEESTGLRLSNNFNNANQRFVKTTIKSSSRNNFEVQPDSQAKSVRSSRIFNAQYEE